MDGTSEVQFEIMELVAAQVSSLEKLTNAIVGDKLSFKIGMIKIEAQKIEILSNELSGEGRQRLATSWANYGRLREEIFAELRENLHTFPSTLSRVTGS